LRYAKLIEGKLSFAPNPIRIGGEDIYTTDPTPYGYKLVIHAEAPRQEGYYAVFDGWEETETEIRQKWRLEPIPEEDATAEDYEAALAELGVS